MLNQKLREALRAAGIEELTELQVEAFRKISSGKDVLIIAPTGSGKTEAAIIPIFEEMLKMEKPEGIVAIYITPLRH